MRFLSPGLALLSLGFLGMAVLWPRLAERMLQMLLATLALGFVGARLIRAGLPARMTRDVFSPFDGRGEVAPPPRNPSPVRRLAAEFRAADDPEGTGRTAIPPGTAGIIAAEVSRRLSQGHALNLSSPGDHDRIRSLLAPATWALVGPASRRGDGGSVPLSELSTILDDLETL